MNEFLNKISSIKAILSAIVIVLAVVVYLIFKKCTKNYIKNHKDTALGNSTAMRVTYGIIEFLIIFLGIVLILEINGVNITAIVTGLGLLSAVVGLALQDYLKDIIMGVHILSDHFFSVGECVEYMGREGMIIGVTLKTTKIGDLDDHSVITVCNRNISEIRRLSNRMDIDVPLSYKENTELVSKTLENVCGKIEKEENVSSAKYLGTQKFEASAIMYRIRIFCEPKNRADIRRFALATVISEFGKANISIPFNQLDVHCDMVK